MAKKESHKQITEVNQTNRLLTGERARQVSKASDATSDNSDSFGTAGHLGLEEHTGYVTSPSFRYRFAIQLFGELLAETDKGSNLIFSPAGLATLLRMIQEGTEEGSRIDDKICEFLSGCYTYVESEETDGFRLEHASSLWYNEQIGLLKEEYIGTLTRDFESEVHNVDFTNQAETKRLVDRWVSRKTHGMIPSLDAGIGKGALLVLLDAIYMNGKWESPFDADKTEKGIFRNADGSESKVDMMYQYLEWPEYGETDEYQVIKMPYLDSQYSMVLVKPKRGITWKMSYADYAGWMRPQWSTAM